jgi:spermidine synthase
MRATVSATFLVSGMAGLMFEVVWFHRTGLLFGNSVWATSLVLSSFMAGLAIGNASVAWYAGRVRRPLLSYATLEAVVATTGVALSLALPHLTGLLVPLTRLAGDSAWIVNLIRVVAAFSILLLPAAAMGATLPLLTGALSRAGAGIGQTLGLLYGWNTLGAVLGVVLAEVVLVDRFGVTGTAWTAGALSLAAATSGRLLSRRFEPLPQIADPSPAVVTRSTRRLLAAAFLAGADLLALEVVWFRFLSMYVLTTTLAVSIMLAAVLAAIGVGSLAASRWMAMRAAARHLPAAAWLCGCAVVGSYAGFQHVTGGAQIGDWPRVLWFACALTFPGSFLSGIIFTLIGEAVHGELRSATRAAAALTFANTVGAAIGPPLAAFVLLPVLGMDRTFLMLAAGYGAIGLLALPLAWSRRPIGAAAAGLALIAALALFPSGLAAAYFTRAAQPYTADGSEIVATREGPAETILLTRQRWLQQPVYSRLVTNGFSMSGTAISGQRYMRDFVYWPLLLHASPLRRILVICYGVGVTVGAALDVAAARTIDVVELSRDIVAMSEVIYPPGARPLDDPRVRLHVEDGRAFLQTTTDRYDLITGEPPPPRTPGAVNIYTREYFRLIYDRLADGGMTTYWLPVARPDPGADVNTVIRAFCEVFDDCSLWNATPFDFMLVGTRHAPPQTLDGLMARWTAEPLARRLREVGFEQPEQIGSTFLGDAGYLRALTASTPPLTDDFPHRIVPVSNRPSLSDPRYRDDPAVVDLFQRVLDPARARETFSASPFIAGLWPRELAVRTLPAFALQRVVNRVLWEGGQPLSQIEDLHLLLTATPLRTLPLWLLGGDEVTQRITASSDERSGPTEFARGTGALAGRDYRRAAAFFSEAERRGLQTPTVRPLLVYALCMAGDVDSARRLARGASAGDPGEQHFWRWLHDAYGI